MSLVRKSLTVEMQERCFSPLKLINRLQHLMINTTISNQFLGAVKFMTNVMAVYRIKTHVISHWMFIQEYTPETILALAVVSSDWVKNLCF